VRARIGPLDLDFCQLQPDTRRAQTKRRRPTRTQAPARAGLADAGMVAANKTGSTPRDILCVGHKRNFRQEAIPRQRVWPKLSIPSLVGSPVGCHLSRSTRVAAP